MAFHAWPWSYGSWIYNYLSNQCLSPLMSWVRISIKARCTTLCDKVCQWLATCRWFPPGPLVSSTNKTDRHVIAEILLKVYRTQCVLFQSCPKYKYQACQIYQNVSIKIHLFYHIQYKVLWSTIITRTFTVRTRTAFPSGNFSWARVVHSLVYCLCSVLWIIACPFYFGHCVVCPIITASG
jgi:hypothetical protein